MEDTIKPIQKNTLWTRDFTIITIGSVVSMLGTDGAAFAMSLLVLDFTGSSLYYALYLAMYMLPSIFVPILSGPFLDRYSRKRAIYTLDFCSAAIFVILAVTMVLGKFNFPLFALATFLMGCIDGVYSVAYESFYPLLITEGNFSKAYSISSTLQTLTTVMMPISALAYNTIGIVWLFAFDAVTFFVAALFEMHIEATEKYIETAQADTTQQTRRVAKQFVSDFKAGLLYLASEPGLLAITAYFLFSGVSGGVQESVFLPYFKGAFANGEYWFTLVIGMGSVGRLVGGLVHYRVKFPTQAKYAIALGVYLTMALIDGTMLYVPLWGMVVMMLVSGLLGVTSYNIRISSTQHYVPDEKKGRYNGMFGTFMTCGMLIGQVAGGALAEVVAPRAVVTGFAVLQLAAALFFVGRKHKEVSAIYNTQV